MMKRAKCMSLAPALLASVFLAFGSAASAEVEPPHAAPDGQEWTLGPELIPNGDFETGTVGATPEGWRAVQGSAQATKADAFSGKQSMEITSLTKAKFTIPTTADKYYRYEVHWAQQKNDWGPNLRIGLVKDPAQVLPPDTAPSGNGVELLSSTDDWPDAVFELANGRQTMYRDYAHETTWQEFTGTFKVLPSITDFGGHLQPTFLGTGDKWLRVDGLSLREWKLTVISKKTSD